MLKVEFLDVLFRKDKRFAKQDVITFDFELTKASCPECCGPWFQLAFCHRSRGVNGQIAEVGSVPENYRRRDPRPDVTFVVIRQPEANHLHIGAAALLYRF